MQNSLTETSLKNGSYFTPPAPPNKSLVGGVSSFNTYLSYKSYNLSKSPIKTYTKLTSEELSQSNSFRNLSFPNYYNHINKFYLHHFFDKILQIQLYKDFDFLQKYTYIYLKNPKMI